ncbi:hypothetical protein [Hydrogenophaga sp. 2FB]|uniref:hypothetical protein n=1 Tax=Hydrogenophaga sp. 2FB TaxID=2502187 RepID=UPI0010F87BED|nr:hypothetical protein [Hydrogenophaga sp. 2FB]
MSFEPDALLRVIMEIPFARIMEDLNYEGYLAIVAWGRSVDTGSQMQQGTREELDEVFMPVKSRGGVKRTPDDLRLLPPGLSKPWRLTRFSYWGSSGRTGRRLLTRLAYFERMADRFARLPQSRKEELAPEIASGTDRYWKGTGLGLVPGAILLLDATLNHLAWLDDEFSRSPAYVEAGAVIALADPRKRSMRNWFNLLLKSVKCANLLELHALVDRRGGRIRDEIITHGRLKKWASSSTVFPFESAKVVLTACYGDDPGSHPEVGLLWCAKVLTFLTEMVMGFSAGPVAPLVAQGHIHVRLQHLREELRATKGARPEELFFL